MGMRNPGVSSDGGLMGGDVWPQVGAYADVQKAKESKNLRRGKGKMRNRRYVLRKGPLLVVKEESAVAQQSFRNIPGLEVLPVNRLNLLKVPSCCPSHT